jgi:hypothetical protein
MVLRWALGAFLVFFAAVHGGYEPTPQPAGAPSFWRGQPGESWLLAALGPGPSQAIGQLLWVSAMVAFLAGGFALIGAFVPRAWWRPLTVFAAAASLLLAVLFRHPLQWASAAVDVLLLGLLLGLNWPAEDLVRG